MLRAILAALALSAPVPARIAPWESFTFMPASGNARTWADASDRAPPSAPRDDRPIDVAIAGAVLVALGIAAWQRRAIERRAGRARAAVVTARFAFVRWRSARRGG